MELLARFEAVTRRGRRMHEKPQVFAVDCFQVDCTTRTISREGVPVELSGKDFDLAVLFLGNQGRLLSRSYIHDVVWGANGCVTSRTIDTHVTRIRSKLGLVSSEAGSSKLCMRINARVPIRLQARVDLIGVELLNYCCQVLHSVLSLRVFPGIWPNPSPMAPACRG